MESNRALTIFPSAARTATPDPVDEINYGGAGVVVVVDVTAVGVTPSVVFTVQGKDLASGKYYTLVASAAIVATGTTVLRVYPGLTAAAGLTVSDVLPLYWRVIATHGNSVTITYSVGACVIP